MPSLPYEWGNPDGWTVSIFEWPHCALWVQILLYTWIFVCIFCIFIIIYFNCKRGFTRWQWCYNKIQHTNNTMIKQNTAHKATHTINTLHKMNTTITTTIYKLMLIKISMLYTKQYSNEIHNVMRPSLQSTTIHFTSPHFTSLRWSPTPSLNFALFITSLTLFLNLLVFS